MLYADLQAAVGEFLGRADVYSQVPTFIQLAEARMNLRLRTRRQVVSNATLTIATEYVNAPADFLGPITLTINPSENGAFPFVLDNRSPDDINEDIGNQGGVAGQPRAYAVVGTTLHFSPIADQSYTGYLTYFGALAALTGMNTSNWVLANFPHAYLYGTLFQAGLYGAATGKPDQRTPGWGQLFEQALQEIESADRNDAFGARIVPRVQLIV